MTLSGEQGAVAPLRTVLKALPPHKALFGCAAGKGLPIGNLNSQFFANVSLDALDQFVKHELKCRHYLRYRDDFVLLSADREQLPDWKERIANFLCEHLLLELNPPSIDTQDFTDTKIFLRSWLFGTSSWFRSMKSNRRFFGII